MAWLRIGEKMSEFLTRYGRSIAVGVALHLVAAGLVSYLNFHVSKTPPNIMEVTLAGGGGGGGGAGFVDTKKLNALGSFCTSGYNLDFITDQNLDTSNVTQFGSLFQGSTQLSTAPALDYSKGSSLIYIFKGCANLETVPEMDLQNCWALDGAFEGCTALKNISFVEGTIQVNVDFSACTLLTNASLLSILKGIKTSVGWKTLKLPANTEATITGDETMNALLQTIRAANWTVSFI